MGLQGDTAREGLIGELCQQLLAKINKYADQPEVIKALKEFGRQMIHSLANIPEWSYDYLDQHFHP